MSYLFHAAGDVVGVRWLQNDPADARSILDKIRTVTVGITTLHKPLFLSVLDIDSGVPTREDLQKMAASLSDLGELVREIRCVVDAPPLRRSRFMAALTAGYAFTGEPIASDMRFFNTAREALIAATVPLTLPIDEVLRRMRKAGVVRTPETAKKS